MKYIQKPFFSALIIFLFLAIGYIRHNVAFSRETLPKTADLYKADIKPPIDLNAMQMPGMSSAIQEVLISEKGGRNKFLPYLPESKTWKYIVIHHSATERGDARVFDKGHRLRGFAQGMGYHFVIDNGTFDKRPGQIETGERWYKQMRGAHCNLNGMNEMGIGICVVGNFDTGKVPSDQLASLVWLVKNLQHRYNIPSRQIIRHKDAKKSTHCPGEHFPWEDFTRMVES